MGRATTFDVIHCGPYGDDPRLAGWRENVGTPVALDAGPAGHDPPSGGKTLTVLSWNLWIGRGHLDEVVSRIRQGNYAELGIDASAPLVVLAQEALRTDDSVPRRSNGWAPRERTVQSRPRHDIVDLAGRLGMHLRYAPSMRNGTETSDRGNAILSSLPLTGAAGLEVPLVFQRRVSVTGTIELAGRQLRLLSAHLDPRGPPDHRWLGAAGRALHAQHLLPTIPDDDAVVLGADLNLARGRRERTWRLLSDAGFTMGVPGSVPSWRHTYHALPRLVLDYILFRNRRHTFATAAVHRLDQDPHDRGTTVFGSDHHPLLARVELA